MFITIIWMRLQMKRKLNWLLNGLATVLNELLSAIYNFVDELNEGGFLACLLVFILLLLLASFFGR